MNIVIDGRMWAETGPGRYIRNLILNLQRIDNGNKYYVLLLKKDLDSFPESYNFEKVEANFKWYTVAEQLKLPKLLKSLKPGVVHFPMFNVPVFYSGKYVVTIHDLIHQHFQMGKATTHGALVYKLKKLGYEVSYKSALKKSRRIIVPSNFVKEQLINERKIDSQKITVTYEGVDDIILKLAGKSQDFAHLKKEYPIEKPYLFFVGNAHPHKNIDRLIQVFTRINDRYPDYSLILTGPRNFFWKETLSKVKSEKIVFTGPVSDEQLVTLYKNAIAYIQPSLEEGFGIPLLEAMSCSCPVVSSNAASLPEVGGDACFYFDPKNSTDMESKILQLIDDKNLRERLILLGKERYKKFSWEKMARETLEVYQRCA